MFGRWRERAEAAESALAQANTYIADLEGFTRLLDIQREGRLNKFVFARRGEITTITTISTWDDEIEAWKDDLL